MNVQELIEALQEVENKDLDVCLLDTGYEHNIETLITGLGFADAKENKLYLETEAI